MLPRFPHSRCIRRTCRSLWLLGVVSASSQVLRAERPDRSPGAAARQSSFSIADRVEVNYAGTWFPGSIYAARDGRFKVMRDNYSSDDHWVTAAEMRPLARKVVKAAVPTTVLPRVIPNGTYVCMTITGGFATGTPSGSVLGSIHVIGAGSYTALSSGSAGERARFEYDAATGTIVWEGGKLAGFFGKPTESRFGIDTRGIPGIYLVYRVRDGGNLFNLDCRREGA